MKKLSTILAILILPYLANAQWKSFATDYSGNMHTLEVVSETKAFIGANTVIQMTEDGGDTWESEQSTAFYIADISFPSEDVGYFCANNNTIQKTTNGGETWSSQSPGVDPFAISSIDFISETEGVAISYGAVLTTNNGGATWSKRTVKSTTYQRIRYIDANTILACGEGVILRSTNGGLTWSTTNSPFKLYDIFAFSEKIVYMVGSDGLIMKSDDAGATWETLISPSSTWFYAVCFVSEEEGVIGGGQGTLYKTVDGGDSWTKITADRDVEFLSVKDIVHWNNRYLAVMNDGTLMTDSLGDSPNFLPSSFAKPQVQMGYYNGMLTLQGNDASETYRIELFDLRGRQVLNPSLISKHNGIIVNSYTGQVLLYALSDRHGSVITGKLLLVR